MGIRRHIPNALTCCNLLCGCMAIFFSGSPLAALMFVLLAAVFDFFDGFAARALRAYSPIGKDLDSLADMISFGVAPAFVGLRYVMGLGIKAFGHTAPAMVYFFKDDFPEGYIANQPDVSVQMEGNFLPISGLNISLYLIALALPLFIAVFSALRLAKFNNDTRQSDNFIGLATPACAIFYISLAACLSEVFLLDYLEWLRGAGDSSLSLSNPVLCWYYWLPAIIVPLLCWLLVSEIPMFSMKIKNFSWQDNRVRFIFLIIAVVELAMTIIGGFSIMVFLTAIITTYICLNLLIFLFYKRNACKGKSMQ